MCEGRLDALLLQAGERRHRRRVVHVRQHDRSALAPKAAGDGQADATRCAGHDCHLCQVKRWCVHVLACASAAGSRAGARVAGVRHYTPTLFTKRIMAALCCAAAVAVLCVRAHGDDSAACRATTAWRTLL